MAVPMVSSITVGGGRLAGRAAALTAAFLLGGLVAGCSSDSTSPTAPTAVDPGATSVVVDGLDRPTQIAGGPDGQLLVAQLAGGENDATGEIVAIDVATGGRRIIALGLDKPTGVLWADDVLWIMVRRGLVSAPWTGTEATAGALTDVLDDLPFNGRSEGTITALGDGRILYATTGALAGGVAVPGSGTLWAYDPADGSSQAIATGLKNAYGHAVLDDGRIVTTEIGDAADPPFEEVDVVDPTVGPSDFGWPDCAGDTSCAGVVGPLAIFPVSATPTGVAALGDDVYVTLFVTGQLLRIPLSGWQAGDPVVAATEILAGIEGPHTVLARPDGTLWISEHITGRVLAVPLAS